MKKGTLRFFMVVMISFMAFAVPAMGMGEVGLIPPAVVMPTLDIDATGSDPAILYMPTLEIRQANEIAYEYQGITPFWITCCDHMQVVPVAGRPVYMFCTITHQFLGIGWLPGHDICVSCGSVWP